MTATCVTGPFGSGVSTELRRRAEAAASPLVLGPGDFVTLAAEIVSGNEGPVRLLTHDEAVDRIARLRDDGWPATDAEVAEAVFAYEASFLGVEELRVHCDAAGVLDRWEGLAALTDRYHSDDPAAVDASSALVRASLALRDPVVAAAERERFDLLVTDDFQQAGFAENRLLTLLAGRDQADVVVGGHPDAALWPADGRHLDAFPRRFSAGVVRLDANHRSPRFPHLRLLDDAAEEAAIVVGFAGRTVDMAGDLLDVLGHEWPEVLVHNCTDGVLPAPEPTAGRWFDLDLLSGPDVPDDEARRERWLAAEHRRFAVACSRATEQLTVVASPPYTPFVTDLVSTL